MYVFVGTKNDVTLLCVHGFIISTLGVCVFKHFTHYIEDTVQHALEVIILYLFHISEFQQSENLQHSGKRA